MGNNMEMLLRRMAGQNQMKQEMVTAILTGDKSRGEQLATNILNTYGISKEDGVRMANERLPGMLRGFLGNQ